MSGLGAALSDRLNPVLVKEVRQALRGKQFLVGFWTIVCAVTAIGVWVLLSMVRDSHLAGLGATFSGTIYGFMAAALVVFVPLLSFLAMAAEWDEDTHELLLLSDLGPRRIVAGKLSAAAVQALLFLCAFGPFLAFSFLLRGVDLLALSLAIALALGTSITLSSLAIALASLARGRFLRGVLLLALLGLAAQCALWLTTFAYSSQRQSFVDLSQPQQQAGLGFLFLFLALLGGLGFTVACARLAHAEENRSTGLRALATGALLAGCAWMLWVTRLSGSVDVSLGMSFVASFLAALTAVFTTTEPEALGRRSSLRMPRSLALATLFTPFLPGGGRGVLLYGLHLALIAAALAAGPFVGISLSSYRPNGWLAFGVLNGFLLGIVLLPAGRAAKHSRRPRVRAFARVATLLLLLALTFAPTLVGFFIGSRPLMQMEHAGNFFWVVSELLEESYDVQVDIGIALAFVLAIAALVINAPRAGRGLAEVRAASRARVARELAAGRTAEPPAEPPAEPSSESDGESAGGAHARALD